MSQHEKIPYIDVDEMHERVVEFYGEHDQPDTLFAILGVYQEQAEILEEIEEKMFEYRDSELFEKWRQELHEFAARIEWYAEAVEGADDPHEASPLISEPLFDGVYPEELETRPEGPDGHTVWKLANELVLIGDQRDLSEASLEEMKGHYESFVEVFWNSIGDELARQIEAMEDADEEMQKAVDEAYLLAKEHPEKVVGLRNKRANEGRRSMAPLLLAAGAILLMAKRKGRR